MQSEPTLRDEALTWLRCTRKTRLVEGVPDGPQGRHSKRQASTPKLSRAATTAYSRIRFLPRRAIGALNLAVNVLTLEMTSGARLGSSRRHVHRQQRGAGSVRAINLLPEPGPQLRDRRSATP